VKFGAVIGNPPYQRIIKNTSDKQIYNYFMEVGYVTSSLAVFISPGKFLFNAGKTPKTWNEKMLNDKHLSVVRYEPSSKTIFPNIELSSSIVITIRDCSKELRPIKKFYVNSKLKNIVIKVTSSEKFKSIMNEIYLQSKFNIKVLLQEHPDMEIIIGDERRLITSILQKNIDIFTDEKNINAEIKIYGNDENGNMIYKYIDRKYIDDSQKNLDGYKVLLAATNGAAGNLGEEKVNVIGKPKIIEQQTGFTQTFISIGNFNKFSEVNNLEVYLRSKFARFMIGTLKATQRLNRDVFSNLPLQDFTIFSDIDWSKAIEEIDEQLFNKYNLSEEEKEYIRNSIKDM
jgi:eco57I restriction endonuclease